MLTVDFQRPTNPFATRFTAPGAHPYRWMDPVDGEIRSSDRDSLDWLVHRILDHRCSAIVGPHGSGKSSLLAALEAPLRQRCSVLHRLSLEPRRTPRLWPDRDAAWARPCIVVDRSAILRGRGKSQRSGRADTFHPRAPERSLTTAERSTTVRPGAVEETGWVKRFSEELFGSASAARQVIATLRAIGGSHPGELWLIDGLERLGPGGLRLVTLTARARGIFLLVTVHRPWRFLPVVWETELNASLAKRLTLDRLNDWPEYAEPLLDSWDNRWRRAAGNLRELWFQLFDEFEILDRTASAPRAPLSLSDFPSRTRANQWPSA